jgi:hypothetical protein
MVHIAPFAVAIALLVVPPVFGQIPVRKSAPVWERIGTWQQVPQQAASGAVEALDLRSC